VATSNSVSSYQWKKDDTDIPGATSATYTISSVAVADAGSYTCVLINSCGTTTSNAATLTVNSIPVITSQPVGYPICYNSVASATVTATGATSYQWRYITSGGVHGNLSGQTTATMNSTISVGGANTFYCYVTNSCGTVTTNTITFSAYSGYPSISVQPIAQNVCAGSSALLSVTASNTSGYQWYKNGVAISGETSSTLSFPSLVTSDSALYKCVLSNPCLTTTSSEVLLRVNSSQPNITTQPVGSTVCLGASVTFNVVASNVISYAWKRSGATVGTSSSLTTSTTGTYTCEVTNGCGVVTSNAATLTNYSAPAITVQPVSASVCAGNSTTFSVTATDATTYQWLLYQEYWDNNNEEYLFDFLPIVGATSSSYTTNTTGRYYCQLSNCNSNYTYTNEVVLSTSGTAPTQPSIVTPSASASQSSTITYAVTNVAGVTYSWTYSGTGATISGNGTNSISIDFAANATSGTLSVTPSNSCGSGTQRSLSITLISANIEIWNGSLLAGYSTLKSAFDAINSGTYTGAIDLKVTRSTTEIASAILNASGVGGANYTSVHVYPTTTGLSVSGNITGPLIDLNGADNVIIDGRINASGSGKDLIISNTSTSNSSAISTIRFINDATNNLIEYCTIKGSEANTSSGIIFFATTSGPLGNDNNTIDQNNITSVTDANRPINAIYSYGSSSYENSSNTISNNNIYDFLSKGNVSNGILINLYSSSFSITGNNFYETTSFTPTASVGYAAINIDNSLGNGFVINNNYIGGQSSSCGGGTWTKNIDFNNQFSAIKLMVGTTSSSEVNGNVVKNFYWSNSGGGDWYGIAHYSGNVNVGTSQGNTIGSTTGNSSVTLNSNASGAYIIGIFVNGTGNINCQNNIIGSLSATNSNSTYAVGLSGIYVLSSNGLNTISNNIIGSTITSNSFNASSLSTTEAQPMYGIFVSSSNATTVNSNTIANLTNGTTNITPSVTGLISGIYSNTSVTISNNNIYNLSISNANNNSSYTASVTGISLSGSTLKTVNGNTIHNLSNINTSFTGSVIGLYFEGNIGLNRVSKNFIHSLSVSSSTTSASIYGIKIASGTTTYSNNIISLVGNTSSTVYGVYDLGAASQSCNLYHNTIYIGGSLGAGVTNKSYALYSASSSNTKDYRNNIFTNARSTSSGSNLHYPAFLNYALNSDLTTDYNDYYSSGVGGVTGSYNNSKGNFHSTLGYDDNSLIQNPQFINPGSTVASDYQVSVRLQGIPVADIIDDFGAISRAMPTMGAWEADATLPVSMISFEAKCNQNEVLLNWKTASETSSSYFEIQKSKDLNDWISIGKVGAAGNSNQLLSYDFTISNSVDDDYYRLKQVDLNGTFEFSKTIISDCKFEQPIQVYPIPTSSKLNIAISEDYLNSKFILKNGVGAVVLIGQLNDKINIINLENLPKGMYFLTIEKNGMGISVSKVVVD
jgi:hypothetical protein